MTTYQKNLSGDTNPTRNGRQYGLQCGFLLALGMAIFLALNTQAQDISTYATVKDPEKFSIDWKSFYLRGTEMTRETRGRVRNALDLAYGDDPKQKLDLYLPETVNRDTSILLFLHGGGFVEGDRLHYGFVAEPFTRKNVAVAVASYRLSSAGFSYPAPLDDTKQAMAWLYKHAEDYGYNKNLLFISGHSAGAILVAEAAVDRAWMEDAGLEKSVLKGVVPISGTYDLRTRKLNAFLPDEASKLAASATFHVVDPAPAFLVALGGEEVKNRADSLEFAHRLLYAGARTQYLELEGADHAEIVEALGNETSPMFVEVMKMIRAATPQ